MLSSYNFWIALIGIATGVAFALSGPFNLLGTIVFIALIIVTFANLIVAYMAEK